MLQRAVNLVQQMSEHQSVKMSNASRQNSSKSLPKRKKETTISINKNQKKMPTENNDTASVKSNGSMHSNNSKKKQTTIKPSKGLLNKNSNNLMPNLQSRSPQQNELQYQTKYNHKEPNRFLIEQSEVKNFQVIGESNKWSGLPIQHNHARQDRKAMNLTENQMSKNQFSPLNVQLKAPPKFSPFNEFSDHEGSDEEPVVKINQPQKLKKDSFVTNDPRPNQQRKKIYQQNTYDNQVESTYSKPVNQSQRSLQPHSRIFGNRRQDNSRSRNKSNQKGQEQRKKSKSKLGGLLREHREKNESKFTSNFSNASIGSLNEVSRITASKIPGNYPRGQMTKVQQIQLHDNSNFDLGSDLELSHSQHDHKSNAERGKQSLQFVFQKEKKKGITISSKNVPVVNLQESSQMVDITGNLVSKSIPRPLQKVAFNKQEYSGNNSDLSHQQERAKQEQKRKMKERIIEHNRKLEEQRKRNQQLKRQQQQRKQRERIQKQKQIRNQQQNRQRQRIQRQRQRQKIEKQKQMRNVQLQNQRIIKANREIQQRQRLQRIDRQKRQKQLQQKKKLQKQRQICRLKQIQRQTQAQRQRREQEELQRQNLRKKQAEAERKRETQIKIQREKQQYRQMQLKEEQQRREKYVQQKRMRKQMEIEQIKAAQRQPNARIYQKLNNAPSTLSKDLSSGSDRSRSKSKDGKRKKQSTIKTSKPISKINDNLHVSPRAEKSFYEDQSQNKIKQNKNLKQKQFKIIGDVENQVEPLVHIIKQESHDTKRKLISFSEQQDSQEKYTITDQLKSQTDVNFYNANNSSQKDLSQHSYRKPPSSRPPLSKKSVGGSSSHSKSRVKESSLSRQKAGNIMKKDKPKNNANTSEQNPNKKLSLLQLAMRKDSGSEYGRSDSEADNHSVGSRDSRNSKGSKKSLKKESSIKMKQNVLNLNKPSIASNYQYHEPIKTETQMKIEPRKVISKDVFFINQHGRLVKQDLVIQGNRTFGIQNESDVEKLVYQKMKRSRERRKSKQLERSRSRSHSRLDSKDKKTNYSKTNKASSRGFATDYDQSCYDGSRVENAHQQSNTLRQFLKPNQQIPMRKNQQLQQQFYDQGYSSYQKSEQMEATTLNDLFGKGKKGTNKLEHSASKRSIHRTEKSSSRRY